MAYFLGEAGFLHIAGPRKVTALGRTSISDDPEMERMNRFDTRGVRSTR